MVKILDSDRITGFEVNISCPNIKTGGVAFGQDPKLTERIVKAVRRETKKIVITKLTANFIDPVVTAKAAVAGGSDAISLINTIYGLAINHQERKYFLGGKVGGLSGPAIKPVALYMVYKVAGTIDLPIVGCGGITTATDTLEFLMAGASAIQVGTASFTNPRSPLEVLQGIEQFMRKEGIEDITELIGAARR